MKSILEKVSLLVPVAFGIGLPIWYVISVLTQGTRSTSEVIILFAISPVLFVAGYVIGVGFVGWITLSAAGASTVLEGAESSFQRLVYWPLAAVAFVFLLLWLG